MSSNRPHKLSINVPRHVVDVWSDCAAVEYFVTVAPWVRKKVETFILERFEELSEVEPEPVEDTVPWRRDPRQTIQHVKLQEDLLCTMDQLYEDEVLTDAMRRVINHEIRRRLDV